MNDINPLCVFLFRWSVFGIIVVLKNEATNNPMLLDGQSIRSSIQNSLLYLSPDILHTDDDLNQDKNFQIWMTFVRSVTF